MLTTRQFATIIVAGMALIIAAKAPSQTPLEQFGAASIKPSDDTLPLRAGAKVFVNETRVNLSGVPLKQWVEMAFELKPYQVVGPDWLSTKKFDLTATIPAGIGKQRLPEMLQALLAERFLLKYHRETTDQPVYGLVVLKGGPKLAQAGASEINQDSGSVKMAKNGRGFSGKATMSDTPFGREILSMEQEGLHFEFLEITMAGLSQFLSQRQLDLPVIDMTGLKGHYQIALDISQEDMLATIPAELKAPAVPGGELAAPSGKSIFASIEKLGLKLEKTKSPIAQIIVDHAEKMPTVN